MEHRFGMSVLTFFCCCYSGLSSDDERRVTPVYLRCREGSVSWLYPRGALRLLFRPSLPADEKDFRVCIRVIRRPDPPDLFHTLRLNDTGKISCIYCHYKCNIFVSDFTIKALTFNSLSEAAERFPARLFVEGARKLVPLYAPDDGDPRELRCFRSRRGRAALYVEAEPEPGTKRRVATFKYEAKPLQRRHYDPATSDCRPCTDSEMELAFCTSDLGKPGPHTLFCRVIRHTRARRYSAAVMSKQKPGGVSLNVTKPAAADRTTICRRN